MKRDLNKRRPSSAFSLIELVIVVVIIGVIGAIAIPRLSRFGESAPAAEIRASADGWPSSSSGRRAAARGRHIHIGRGLWNLGRRNGRLGRLAWLGRLGRLRRSFGRRGGRIGYVLHEIALLHEDNPVAALELLVPWLLPPRRSLL